MAKYFQNEVQGPDQSGMPHHALAARRIGHMLAPQGDLAARIKTAFVGMVWCIRGLYQDETDGEGLYTVRSGEFGVIFPGKTLLMRALEDGTEIRYLAFDGESAVRECLNHGLWEGVFRDTDPPFSILDAMSHNLRNGDQRRLCLASGSLRDLLAISGDHARKAASDKLIHNARRLIHTHYGNPAFNMQTLQDEMGISRTSLNVRFKEDTGTSPHAYLLRLRVREACHMLRDTDLPIAKIGRCCGFTDPSHFTEVIRKRTGHSPRVYRQACVSL